MMAVVLTVVTGSHEFSERIVALNVCRLVCGTTSNVHVVAPTVAGCGPFGPGATWIVTVPCHVPARNDCDPDGPVGADDPPPQPLASAANTRREPLVAPRVIRALLRVGAR